MSHAELEGDLRDLATTLDWTPTPDVAAEVATRLRSPARKRQRAFAAPRLQLAIAVLAALIVAAAAVPPVRAAIERALGIAAGERIERVQSVTTAAPRLDLGRLATLREANAAAGFAVRVPSAVGEPDEIRIGGDLGRRSVSLLYGTDTVLTQSAGPNVGIVLKQIGPDVVGQSERVGDAQAFWIGRGPRVLTLLDRDLKPFQARSALPGAGALLWTSRGVVFHLETRRSRTAAVVIAESVP
jgi:hypothetical protein